MIRLCQETAIQMVLTRAQQITESCTLGSVATDPSPVLQFSCLWSDITGPGHVKANISTLAIQIGHKLTRENSAYAYMNTSIATAVSK